MAKMKHTCKADKKGYCSVCGKDMDRESLKKNDKVEAKDKKDAKKEFKK